MTPANNNEAVGALLDDLRDYFDQRADVVDGSYGDPAPNTEMRILQEIDAVLAGKQRDPLRSRVTTALNAAHREVYATEEAAEARDRVCDLIMAALASTGEDAR